MNKITRFLCILLMFIITIGTTMVSANAVSGEGIGEVDGRTTKVVIYDNANLLSEQEEQALYDKAKQISSIVDVLMVTVQDNPFGEDYNATDEYCGQAYAQLITDQPKFDDKTGKNEGIVLCIDMTSKYVYLGTYGLYTPGLVNGVDCDRITENTYTYVDSRKYAEFFNQSLDELSLLLFNKKISQPFSIGRLIDDPEYRNYTIYGLFILGGLLVVLVSIRIWRPKAKRATNGKSSSNVKKTILISASVVIGAIAIAIAIMYARGVFGISYTYPDHDIYEITTSLLKSDNNVAFEVIPDSQQEKLIETRGFGDEVTYDAYFHKSTYYKMKAKISFAVTIGSVSSTRFSDYNNKTVRGRAVKQAIDNFANEGVAILINNLAFQGTNPSGSYRGVIANTTNPDDLEGTTISFAEVSGDDGKTSLGRVSGYTTNKQECAGIWFVNYNAVLGSRNDYNGKEEITQNLTVSDFYQDAITGTYIYRNTFVTNSRGEISFYLKTMPLSKKGDAQYVADSATYKSNLIKNTKGDIIGIVFVQQPSE